MKNIAVFVSILACVICLLGFSGCPINTQGVMAQYSTYQALAMGIFDGDLTMAHLHQLGNFGLGTFNHLDGEMIVLDGVIYQAKSDGKVYVVDKGDLLSPFATVIRWRPSFWASVNAGLDFNGLCSALDMQLPSINYPCAVRIDAVLPSLKFRTVPRQERPFPPLSTAVQSQIITERQNIEGTLIIIRMPPYSGAFNAAGYHMHFISKDRTQAGHVLGLATPVCQAGVAVVPNLRVELPPAGDFPGANLTPATGTEHNPGGLMEF